VAIARAIAQEPALLVADEPTGALDSATTRQIMELLVALHRTGMTLVLVTHDPSVATYASRVITIRDGDIVSDAPPPRALGTHRSPLVALGDSDAWRLT
jgi:putative ABC transport system ATP-binding protein